MPQAKPNRCSHCEREFRDQSQLIKHTKEGCPADQAKKARVHIMRDEGKYNSLVASKPIHQVRNFTINNNIDNNLQVLCIQPSAELVDCTLSPPMWPNQFKSLLMVDVESCSKPVAECHLLERLRNRIQNPLEPLRFDFRDQSDVWSAKEEKAKLRAHVAHSTPVNHTATQMIIDRKQLSTHLKWNLKPVRILNQLLINSKHIDRLLTYKD